MQKKVLTELFFLFLILCYLFILIVCGVIWTLGLLTFASSGAPWGGPKGAR